MALPRVSWSQIRPYCLALGLVFAGLPSVVAQTVAVNPQSRPLGEPKDSKNKYFAIETKGVDGNHKVKKVCIEVECDADGSDGIDDADVLSDEGKDPISGGSRGGIPKGWTRSIEPSGKQWFLCFLNAAGAVDQNVRFDICVKAQDDTSKPAKPGTGAALIYEDPDDPPIDGRGSGYTKILYNISTVPTLPAWGLAALMILMLAGGAVFLTRIRESVPRSERT